MRCIILERMPTFNWIIESRPNFTGSLNDSVVVYKVDETKKHECKFCKCHLTRSNKTELQEALYIDRT